MLTAERGPATRRVTAGTAISAGVVAVSSLSGGITVAVTLAGRTGLTSMSMRWLATLLCSTLLFAAWGLLYAEVLHRRRGLARPRALYLSALCHLPILLGLGLVQALYASDLANHVYSISVYGSVAYRPLVLASLVGVPALLQGLVAALLTRSRTLGYLIVAAPVIVGLVLRLWSVDWQLPYALHNDEQNYLGPAMISWAHGDPDPHRFLNPSLLVYVDTGLYLLLGGDKAQIFRVFANAFGHQVWDPKGFYLIYLAARGLVALLGTATIPVVYLATKELFNRRAALFAAWFMAVAFLHVRNSHYATNDVAATFFAAVSFLFAAKLYKSGRLRHYLWAGFFVGAGTATKYNVGLSLVPILVAHLARQERPLVRKGQLFRDIAPLLASYTAAGLGFVLGVPYSVLEFGEFLGGFQEQLHIGRAPWFGQQLLPVWWMHLTTMAQGFGLLPSLLAVLGAIALLRRARGALIVAAAFPVGYYAFMSGQQLFFARFTIPMLPFAAVLAGCGTEWAAGRLGRAPLGRQLTVVLLAAALAQGVVLSIQGDLVNGREDTRVLADRWVSANVPSSAMLLVDDISDLRPNQPWPSRPGLASRLYNPFTDPTPWRQETHRPVFVAISSFGYDGFLRGAGDPNVLPDPYRTIEREGSLVAAFGPGPDGAPVDYSQDDTYTPFWHVMDYVRPGPTIRIYEMNLD